MTATEPFRFQTASYLVRIGNLECMSLVELQKGSKTRATLRFSITRSRAWAGTTF
jgi:hypothetical protein